MTTKAAPAPASSSEESEILGFIRDDVFADRDKALDRETAAEWIDAMPTVDDSTAGSGSTFDSSADVGDGRTDAIGIDTPTEPEPEPEPEPPVEPPVEPPA